MVAYENNIEALKKHTSLYKYTQDADFAYDNIEIEAAKNGEPIIVYNVDGKRVYFNSKYSPSNEAEKFLSDVLDMPDESVLVMFGLGSGVWARTFMNKKEHNVHCIVYEPSLEIFNAVIKNIDISDLLLDEGISIIVKDINHTRFQKVFKGLLGNFNRNNNRCIVINRYADYYLKEIYDIKRIIDEGYDALEIQNTTALRCAERVFDNNIKNIRFIEGMSCGSDFVNYFPEDMPAIVVSSGPSLKKNVSLVKEAKGRALIFSTDSAYDILLEHGVVPDMLATIDLAKPGKFFKGEGIERVPFVISPDANTEILEFVRPKHIVMGSGDSVLWQRLYRDAGKELPDMSTGGSVATFAIANLVYWGFKRIILIGQDLAFTGNKIHARDDDDEKIEIDDRHYTYVEGQDGEQLPVRKDYFQYLRWIEEFAYEHSDVEIIDATEGGSKKAHTTVMTLRDVIDRYCKKEYNVGQMISEIPRYFTDEDIAIVRNRLVSMKSELEKLRQRLADSVEYCRLGGSILESGQYDIGALKKINAFIGETDDMLLTSEEASLMDRFVTEAEIDFADDMYEQDEDDIKEAVRMYEKSRRYYSLLMEKIPEAICMMDELLHEMFGGDM